MKGSWAMSVMTRLFTVMVGISAGSLAQAETPRATAMPAFTQVAGPSLPPEGSTKQGEQPVESTSLEELLLEKSMISMDAWIRIKAEEERRQGERAIVAGMAESDLRIHVGVVQVDLPPRARGRSDRWSGCLPRRCRAWRGR